MLPLLPGKRKKDSCKRMEYRKSLHTGEIDFWQLNPIVLAKKGEVVNPAKKLIESPDFSKIY